VGFVRLFVININAFAECSRLLPERDCLAASVSYDIKLASGNKTVKPSGTRIGYEPIFYAANIIFE
jgi:hypothetical protein